jgi:hypothetical protein
MNADSFFWKKTGRSEIHSKVISKKIKTNLTPLEGGGPEVLE